MAIEVASYHYGIVTLPRWNATVSVAQEVDKHIQWFPVRHMCGVLGVEEERQVKIVKESYPHALDTISLRLTSDSPWRPVLCIRRKEMADWVGHIKPEKCKLSARGPLIEFQEELLAAADRLFWRPARSAPEGERAGVTFSARIEVQMHCQDCGAPHYIIHEHGETTVIRIRDEE
jgi:P22_AR N-terminal domain